MSEEKAYDIIEYLEKETRGLDTEPFNEIDALILAVMSYCRFERFVPSLDDNKDWVRLDRLTDEQYRYIHSAN